MYEAFIYVGPFEKAQSPRTVEQWIESVRGMINVERKYKVLSAFNELLMRDHFLLVLYSRRPFQTADGEWHVRPDALAALQGRYCGDQPPPDGPFYELPTFQSESPYANTSGESRPPCWPRGVVNPRPRPLLRRKSDHECLRTK